MIGKQLSHYLIESELGRGGMGIVYRARDTKLDRTVAIKVLPASALASEDDRARFYREAKAAAALNHPNIAQVYQIDEAVPTGGAEEEPRPFIAMEFVDGETLDAAVRDKPLRISEAVRIATGVAGALGVAHEKGIVHRDIKSANVMLTSDGTPKVLDFGLAQTSASTKLTRMGSTLGTVAYMSPEQARGEEVDGRSDLYSLGAVLYEMVAGRAPFAGEYEQAVVYGILNEAPEPLTAVRTGVPMELERIVGKLLAKDRTRRYASAADLVVDLNNLDHTSTRQSLSAAQLSGVSDPPPSPAVAVVPARRNTGMTAAAVVAILAAGLALGWLLSGALGTPDPTEPLTRVRMTAFDLQGLRFPRVSPTQDYLAVRGASTDGFVGLFLKSFDSDEFEYIQESAAGGLWEYDFSPDGSRIAFSQGLNAGVFTVVVPNGIPQRHTEQGRFSFWEDDQTIVFSDDRPGGGDIFRLDLQTGSSTQIEYDRPQLEEGMTDVLKTIDREHGVAYGHQLRRGNLGQFNLFSLDLKSGRYQVIESNAVNPEFVAGGFLTYQLGGDAGKLVVRPLDRAAGEFSGRPIDVLEAGESISWNQYAVTPDGDFMYIPDGTVQDRNQKLWKVDLDEKKAEPIPLILPEGRRPEDVSISRDGRYLSYVVTSADGANIYGYDLEENVQVQYTFGGFNSDPVFGKGDAYLFFAGFENGAPKVRRAPFFGSSIGDFELVKDSSMATAVSGDGSQISVLNMMGSNGGAAQLIDAASGESVWNSAEPGVITPGTLASFSPDGRYVAVLGSGEGRIPIVVRSTSSDERHVLPDVDGHQVLWAPSGNHLYYRGAVGISRLRVRSSPAFSVLGVPEPLLYVSGSRGWALSPDESHIYVSAYEVAFSNLSERSTRTDVVWLQNWSDHLEREFGR